MYWSIHNLLSVGVTPWQPLLRAVQGCAGQAGVVLLGGAQVGSP